MNDAKVIYLSDQPPLPEAEIKAALGGLPRESPVWKGITQIITQATANAMQLVSDSTLGTEQRAHAAGQLDQCLLLRNRLEQYRAAPK